MADLERIYTIPLRREWIRTAKYRRANRSIHAIQNFLKKHMKAEDLSNVKLGKFLNEAIWSRGINNPPHKVRVNVRKDDKGIVFAELYGKEMPKKDDGKKGIGGGKIVEAVTGKKEEKKEAKVEVKTPAKEDLTGAKEIKQELNKLEEKTKAVKTNDDKTKQDHKQAEDTLQRLKKESVKKK